MKIKVSNPQKSAIKFVFKKQKQSQIILPVFKEDLQRKSLLNILPKSAKQALERSVKRGSFQAELDQSLNLSESDILLLGLGSIKEFHPEKMAAAFIRIGASLANQKKAGLTIQLNKSIHVALRSFRKSYSQNHKSFKVSSKKSKSSLGSIEFAAPYTISDLTTLITSSIEVGASKTALMKTESDKSKPGANKSKLTVSFQIANAREKQKRSAIKEGALLGDLVNRSRYLANLPGNILEPASYEAYIRKIMADLPVKTKVIRKTGLAKLGCNGILSVGQGSDIGPRMVIMEYKPKRVMNKQPLVLVGKGVTFDTGGISLKPSPEMHEMKFDMCGSALAVHAIELAARQKLPLHIISLVGLVENVPDGHAIKPGDVYTAYNGKTVEIQNTDAEGRLVLGDMLAYASDKYDPAMIFEYSTLTGACVIALGHNAAGIMTESEELYNSIELASRRSMDRVWRLPHWQSYGTGLKSNIADMRNIAGRAAGTASAMRFLNNFVANDVPWAHFDIAGAAWSGGSHGSQPTGATGWGLRLMNQFYKGLLGI